MITMKCVNSQFLLQDELHLLGLPLPISMTRLGICKTQHNKIISSLYHGFSNIRKLGELGHEG